MSNYSKFKDRAPQDTIFEIRRILNDAGLFTTVQWFDNKYSGVESNRILLYPTDLGTNGKGTDRLYATASAYAELMERIQNNILVFRLPIPERVGDGDFLVQPDERVMTIDEVIAQKDPLLEFLARELNLFTDTERKMFLLKLARTCEHRMDGAILTVPYADLTGDRIVWLPRVLLMEVYGSNGMAAGNTLEEALVQGISELFERYAVSKILRGECVPPVIPEEALKSYSVWNLIEEIRAEGKYAVTVFDCSLGIGLPVTGTAITDLEKGTFGMKLGAHPSFAVSVERTLTETFQGWSKLDGPTGLCIVGSDQAARGYHNIPNVMKIGSGVYPAKLFCGEPDWEFQPWTQWEGLDNRAFLKKMIEQLEQLGVSVLARDVSHMGFPSFHIVVPGLSELYAIDDTRIRSIYTIYQNSDHIGRFPEFTPDEEKKFLLAIKFKERSIIENTLSNLVMLPLSGPRMNADRLGAYLSLKTGDFKEAYRFFAKTEAEAKDPEEKLYLHSLMEFARYRTMGLDQEQAITLLRRMFRKDIAARVIDEVKDPAAMMQKVFPKLHCPDCAACPLAGGECKHPQEKEVFRKIKAAMAHSRVSQETLLKTLKEITSE